MITFEDWNKVQEEIDTELNREYYNMDAGFEYSKEKIKMLEEKSSNNAKLFLKHINQPELVRIYAIEALDSEKTHEIAIKFKEVCDEKIVSSKYKFKNEFVRWGTWRQFASKTPDPKVRKELFDDFIVKSKVLTPIIKKRFDITKKVYKSNKISVIEAYETNQRISLEQLYKLINDLKVNLDKDYKKLINYYEDCEFKRNFGYYDDFYFLRNNLYNPITEKISLEPVKEVKKLFNGLGLDFNKIKLDAEDRKNKTPSPCCWDLHIPDDVRILYRAENPMNDFSSLLHEYGHALQFSNINSNLVYWKKKINPTSIAEIFSILLENLITYKPYLLSLGIKENLANELIQRKKFLDMHSNLFYCANSTLKLDFWSGKIKFNELDSHYSDLTEKYLGIKYPGAYWKLHHIMPRYTLYSPSYLISDIRAAELFEILIKKFGKNWYQTKEAGKFLKDIVRPGAEIDLSFSKLDVTKYTEKLK